MRHLRPLHLLFLALAFIPGCQSESYTGGASATSYPERQLSSSGQSAEAKPPPAEVKPESGASIISTKANLREGPSTSSAILLEVREGDALTLVKGETAGPWYKVRHAASGKTGWVHGNTIRLQLAGTQEPAVRSTADDGDNSGTRTSAHTRGSGDGYDTYVNSFGERVPRPRRSASAPEGASARCGDGTYSFSRSRRGTCSHHGGVAMWL